ncbi:hypothetical protein VTN77DRAFT_5883 [Rasamsonia byssochlamydoides]|uniref:uncharacterized protein n=1 Tax=Rasamsonia byssochlamydoides TaxID=89139 RepID=UPI003742D0CA
MERIQGQRPEFRELAMRTLGWITCAKRPLTTLELQHALAVENNLSELDEDNLPQLENMASVSAGLVTADKKSNIIRLVHYTTQEYFERTWTFWFANAHQDIATVSIAYLSFNIFEAGFCQTDKEFEARLRQYPLYDYSAQNWGHHGRVQPADEPLLLNLLENETKVSACAQALMVSKEFSWQKDYSQRVPRQITGVHLAAYFGLENITRAQVENGCNPDSKDSYERTPLSRAAENGHEGVARLLLEKGADPESKDNSGQTPLSWAASKGHEAVVKLLLEKGIDLESKDTVYG